MAKETIDTVGKLASFIESQLISKRFVANYQPVMIRCLLKNGSVLFTLIYSYEGMNNKKMNDVVFLSKKIMNPYLDKLHTSLNDVVRKGHMILKLSELTLKVA